MPNYSVATTKDQLSRLIDKALAGEEVVITRHGKPTAELRAVEATDQPKASQAEWMERLSRLRASMPRSDVSYLDLKRVDEKEQAH